MVKVESAKLIALNEVMGNAALSLIKSEAANLVGPSFKAERVAGVQATAIVSGLNSLGILPETIEVDGVVMPAPEVLREILVCALNHPLLSQGATMLSKSRDLGIYPKAEDKKAIAQAGALSVLAKFGIKSQA